MWALAVLAFKCGSARTTLPDENCDCAWSCKGAEPWRSGPEDLSSRYKQRPRA